MLRPHVLPIFLAILAAVQGQQVGTLTAETHPQLTTQHCTASGCTTNSRSVTLDSNWRWTHQASSSTNCYTGNTWDTSICPDPTTCASACAIDGADYSGTYGISTAGDALTLKFKTGSNVGSRTYLMASESEYQIYKLLNQEFTFDVDMSNLPCGINGALYFSQMDADGGMAKYPSNKAGAKYGTGYCDSQCPQDLKWINGKANVLDWTPDANNANSGAGQFGTCCSELDVWEANKQDAALTPHPCSVDGQTSCNGTDCGSATGDRYKGLCDKDGCDFNSYRQGNESFFGPGKIIDTTKKITVVTQFHTDDNTATGTLSEIKRFYVQNGKVIANSKSDISGIPADNSITGAFCAAQKSVFGETNYFKTLGGMAKMGESMKAGMVLVMSIWDDYAANMNWLDSTYPVGSTTPGSVRGPCAATAGVPATVESVSAGASVTFSNIKAGDFDTTY